MKKIVISILSIIIILFSVVVSWRIYKVNKHVNSVEEKVYNIGQFVPFEADVLDIETMRGYEIRVNSSEVLSEKEFLEKYNGRLEDIPQMDRHEKIYDINITIKNTTNSVGGINLMDLYIQKNAAIASFGTFHYRIANFEKGYWETAIAIRPNTEIDMQLTFPLPKENFKKKSWENIEKIDMKLIMTLFPTKKCLKLN